MASPTPSSSDPATRILLVEDNDVNRQMLADYLRFYGYNVFTLAGGSLFEQTLTQFQPHIVLLDLKLPDISGYELLQWMRQTLEWRSIPVIVISAYAFQADQQRAMNLGANQYLVKPVKLAHLLTVISDWINPSPEVT